ncbi:MAG: hypothetical protein L7H04_07970 [Vulcanisaeta sp.]|nr:hypothetical protein [Vulcanisaeta sp.]
MESKEGGNVDRIREVLTDEDIKKIEESYKEGHRIAPCHEPSIVIEVDNEFGNMLIKANNRMPKRSSEGMAFVTVGVDENGEIAYIVIEPEDYDLASFIQRIKTTRWS